MKIKPIRNESEYEEALENIESLMDAEEGTEQFDNLEVLTLLVADYEKKHHSIAFPDPIEALKYCMAKKGVDRAGLEEILNCSRGRVSELLSKKRHLNLGMIRKLHTHLDIPTDILVMEYGEYEVEETTNIIHVDKGNEYNEVCLENSLRVMLVAER